MSQTHARRSFPLVPLCALAIVFRIGACVEDPGEPGEPASDLEFLDEVGLEDDSSAVDRDVPAESSALESVEYEDPKERPDYGDSFEDEGEVLPEASKQVWTEGRMKVLINWDGGTWGLGQDFAASPDGEAFRRLVLHALDLWLTTGVDIRVQSVDFTSTDYGWAAGDVDFSAVPEDTLVIYGSTGGGSKAACATRPRKAAMRFNLRDYDWKVVASSVPGSGNWVLGSLIHELGHAFGLNHGSPKDQGCIMASDGSSFDRVNEKLRGPCPYEIDQLRGKNPVKARSVAVLSGNTLGSSWSQRQLGIEGVNTNVGVDVTVDAVEGAYALAWVDDEDRRIHFGHYPDFGSELTRNVSTSATTHAGVALDINDDYALIAYASTDRRPRPRVRRLVRNGGIRPDWSGPTFPVSEIGIIGRPGIAFAEDIDRWVYAATIWSGADNANDRNQLAVWTSADGGRSWAGPQVLTHRHHSLGDLSVACTPSGSCRVAFSRRGESGREHLAGRLGSLRFHIDGNSAVYDGSNGLSVSTASGPVIATRGPYFGAPRHWLLAFPGEAWSFPTHRRATTGGFSDTTRMWHERASSSMGLTASAPIQLGWLALVPHTPRIPDSDGCDDNESGEVGCECLPIRDVPEPMFEDNFADGDLPHREYYCPDYGSTRVCGRVPVLGGWEGRCIDCDDPASWPNPQGGSPPGCPCYASANCGRTVDGSPGICYGEDVPFGEGVCHSYEGEEVPPWECGIDCEAIFGRNVGYCHQDHPNMQSFPNAHAHCSTVNCSWVDNQQCAEQGQVCLYGTCVTECRSDTDCRAWGYPPSYECHRSNVCVPVWRDL